MKFSKNVNNKECAPKIIFFDEIFVRKIRIFFDIENWLWKSEFCHFRQLLLNWLQYLKLFKGLVIGFVPKVRPGIHSSPRRLAGEKKSDSYNHKTTIWVSHEYYLNPEFQKIPARAFWVIAGFRLISPE